LYIGFLWRKAMKAKTTRRKPLRGSARNLPDWSDYRKPNLPPCSNNLSGSTAPTGMLSKIHEESEEVRAEIERKFSRTAPLYSKGAYQYIGDSEDLTSIGRKK
jgi:hypothetical protein